MKHAFLVGFIFVGCYILAPIPTCIVGAIYVWRNHLR